MTHSQLNETLHRVADERARQIATSPSGDSTASSTSTTSSSDELQSTQSSTPPSVKSATLSWTSKTHAADACRATGQVSQRSQGTQRPSDAVVAARESKPVSADQRKNPRRTQPSGRTNGKGQAEPCAPPSLVRQSDRKGNFVEILVDTTSQMIEVIWPLSMVPCGRDSFGGKNLIGLRLFIQEVLRRSKTSYSTLQVALYYLVLIKPCIPKVDFTKEQLEDSHTARAMQCGRRMFLAALILASKYLQDRTYSARAWSKISGLSTAEINSNEIAFVTAVDWKLHIPESLFQRWTDIVLKYSLSSSTPQLQRDGARASWRSIIQQLTPELDNVDISDVKFLHAKRSPQLPMSPPPCQRKPTTDMPSAEPRCAAVVAKPVALEPNFSVPKENFKFPPISPKITQLPTPRMTPNNKAFCTPAVSAQGTGHERSISQAMRQAQSLSIQRSTLDSWPASSASMPQYASILPVSNARRTTILPPASLVSSPESMVSDTCSQSSRSSRSSSISSVASCVGALPQPRLAVQATCRYANMYSVNGKRALPQSVRSHSPSGDVWGCSNPFSGVAEISYLRGQSEDSEAAAAVALQDLALAGSSESMTDRLASPTRNGRKRERSASGVDTQLQGKVQGLLRGGGACIISNDASFAAHDLDVAQTFLLRTGNPLKLSGNVQDFAQITTPTVGSQTGSRKRVCCA